MHLQRHVELTKLIQAANHEYHALSRPSLTDDEYDSLVKELRSLESHHPELAKDSPLQKVGHTATGVKVKHKRPMLSLDNVFTPDELRRFFKTSYSLVVEPKVDGLSLSLTYSKDGKLLRAVTRGDGVEGEDVTHNAKVIPLIPKQLDLKSSQELEVRGEVYISKDDFQELVDAMVKEGDEPFANARNAASGSLKLKDSAEAANRKLSFIAYEAQGITHLPTQEDVIDWLSSLGFQVVNSDSLQDWTMTEEEMEKINAERKALPFDTDGVVFKISDRKIREEMGSGSKAPKWAVAYKFPPEEGVTTLVDVQLQVGRTGTINPVAIMEPVLLNGATVRRASLCNFDEILRLDIAIGDSVKVVRAAEVIPKVVGVSCKQANRRPILPPTSCPSCGQPVVKDPELVAYYCTNHGGCKAQAAERLSHAVSKSCLDWDGFGIAQVEECVNRGYTSLSKVIGMTDTEWMTPAAERKFVAERERIKSAPFWRKLHSLGIPGIGKSFCQELAFKYESLIAITEDESGVAAIVGPSRSTTLFRTLNQMVEEIVDLHGQGFLFEAEKRTTASTQATGKTFVITGTLMSGTRDVVADKIEKAGGIVKSSVGKTTDYLVTGESPGGNKTSAAKKHGTKVLSEEELYGLLGLDFKLASNPLQGVSIEDL